MDKIFHYWNGKQGSDEWKKLRQRYITGTDIPVIMGKSPFCKTLYGLWEKKKGGKSDFAHAAMLRGAKEESYALNVLKNKTGIVFTPAVVIHNQKPYLVSLDGFDCSERFTAEIKTPAKGRESDLWRLAEQGVVPEHYLYQIQHGLMITGAEKCFFFVFDGEFDGVVVEVEPNPLLWKQMMAAADDFYARYIEGDEVPDDKAEVIDWDDSESIRMARRYQELSQKIKELENELQDIKNEFIEKLKNDGADKGRVGDGLVVTRYPRPVRVDWKQVIKEVAPHVDLDEIQAREKEKNSEVVYSYKVEIPRKRRKE